MLWEIFTLGKTPYPGSEASYELYEKIKGGYRMEKPVYATETIYDVMKDCWKIETTERPVRTFSVNHYNCDSLT